VTRSGPGTGTAPWFPARAADRAAHPHRLRRSKPSSHAQPTASTHWKVKRPVLSARRRHEVQPRPCGWCPVSDRHGSRHDVDPSAQEPLVPRRPRWCSVRRGTAAAHMPQVAAVHIPASRCWSPRRVARLPVRLGGFPRSSSVAVGLGRLIPRAVQDGLTGGEGLLDVGFADRSVESRDLGAPVAQQEGGMLSTSKRLGACRSVSTSTSMRAARTSRCRRSTAGSRGFQSAARCGRAGRCVAARRAERCPRT